MGPDWALSPWKTVSVEEGRPRKNTTDLSTQPSGSCRPYQAGPAGKHQDRTRQEGFRPRPTQEIRRTKPPFPEEMGPHPPGALLPPPSSAPANSPTAVLEGLPRAWGALSSSASTVDSGPRVSTGRLWGKGCRQKAAAEGAQQDESRGTGGSAGVPGPRRTARRPPPTSHKNLLHAVVS